MEEGEGSLEGFLCPHCFINFNSALQLSAHYQDQHSEDFFKNIKEIYKKTKKKILFKEQENLIPYQETSSQKPTSGYYRSCVNEEPGFIRSHTEYFKAQRMKKMEHYAAQTNNLLIRLEKLLINLPSDRMKRKVHEQDIVPWLDEKDVRLCPGCAKSFGLLRRKHHCRLCGAIMCTECTVQLSLEMARKITGTSVVNNSLEKNQSEQRQNNAQEPTHVKKLLKSPSSTSVQSVLALDLSNESYFRLCQHCFMLLQMRQSQREVRNQKPIITQFYEKLYTSMNEASELITKYLKMYNSLCSGQTAYSLNDVELLRVKIVNLADNIDFISNKIAILGQNTEHPPDGNQLQLQKAIRLSAINFLKEHIITIPNLPTEEQIRIIQERRRDEIARRLEEERRYEAELKNRFGAATNNQNSAVPSKDNEVMQRMQQNKMRVHVEDGWTPDVSQQSVQNADHPILQQIIIIKGFISQARSANRMDEVVTLKKNLRELEEEFWRQVNPNAAES